jgi:hypothetical protein
LYCVFPLNFHKRFLCAAALPEASLDDLTGQVAALKGKPDPSVCFVPFYLFPLTPSIPDFS